MTVVIPGRLPWLLHRVAVSGYYHDSLDTIATRWSLQDIVDAHDVIDAFDEANGKKPDS